MSRINKKSTITEEETFFTESKEQVVEIEEYKPKHPIIAFTGKKQIKTDHLEDYVEVKPFEK